MLPSRPGPAARPPPSGPGSRLGPGCVFTPSAPVVTRGTVLCGAEGWLHRASDTALCPPPHLSFLLGGKLRPRCSGPVRVRGRDIRETALSWSPPQPASQPPQSSPWGSRGSLTPALTLTLGVLRGWLECGQGCGEQMPSCGTIREMKLEQEGVRLATKPRRSARGATWPGRARLSPLH